MHSQVAARLLLIIKSRLLIDTSAFPMRRVLRGSVVQRGCELDLELMQPAWTCMIHHLGSH